MDAFFDCDNVQNKDKHKIKNKNKFKAIFKCKPYNV